MKVAGLLLSRQRLGTAGGLVLHTQTGVSNNIVSERVFQSHRKKILQPKLLMTEERLQIEGPTIHVIPTKLTDLTVLLQKVGRPRNADTVEQPCLPSMFDGKNIRTQIRENSSLDEVETRNFR